MMKALVIAIICWGYAFLVDAYLIGSGHEEQLLEVGAGVSAIYIVARFVRWLYPRDRKAHAGKTRTLDSLS